MESLYSAISRCSSGVERFLGKEEVVGSIPIVGSMKALVYQDYILF